MNKLIIAIIVLLIGSAAVAQTPNWQELYYAQLERSEAWKARSIKLDSLLADSRTKINAWKALTERIQVRQKPLEDSLRFWNELYRTCKGRKDEPTFQSQLVQVQYWFNTAKDRGRRADFWKARYDSLNAAPYICEVCGDSVNYPQPSPVKSFWNKVVDWILVLFQSES